MPFVKMAPCGPPITWGFAQLGYSSPLLFSHENRAKQDAAMSTNCISCVVNKRTGGDLLCDDCREKQPSRTPLTDSLAFEYNGESRAEPFMEKRSDGPLVKADDMRKLEIATRHLIEVIEAHEVQTLDCDRSGRTYCDCLERAVKKAKSAAERRV